MQQPSSTATVVVERNVEIPMRDGVVLRADVYRPSEGRWPVLVQRTPYDKDVAPSTLVSLPPMGAVAEGFAVVVQDVRGRARSEGVHTPFDEAADGYDTVEWAAQQPWSNGEVGMFGSSYMGATQLQAAVAAPPSLKTICPIQASSDYYEGRTYFGGSLELGSLLTTTLGVTGPGSLRWAQGTADEKRSWRAEMATMLDDLDSVVRDAPLSASVDRPDGPLRHLTPWFHDWVEHDQNDEFWKRVSVEARHEHVDVPALHITSWFDQFHVGTLRNFEGLRQRAASPTAREGQFLIVGPWNHYPARSGGHGAVRVGDVNFSMKAQLHLDGVQLGWFRRHFYDDAKAFRQRSRVRLFVMGVNEWRDEDDWPLQRAVETPMFLALDQSGERTLAPASTSAVPHDSFRYDPTDPVPTHGGAHLVLASHHQQGPVDQARIEARDDVRSFTSPVLESDVEVTGWVSCILWVSSDAPCTDFTVRLSDVHPDGRSISVCDGIRRVELGDPGPSEVSVSLGATSQAFLRGHRIRVSVSSSNSPRFEVNPNTGSRLLRSAETVVAQQTVHLGDSHPSRIVLPVVPR